MIPTPPVVEDCGEYCGLEKVIRFNVRGSLWPDEAWQKLLLRNARAARMAESGDWESAIWVVYPPEIIGLTYPTKGVARGKRGDWKIEFGDPEGELSERISDAVEKARKLFIGQFVENRHARFVVSQNAAIHQVLTTTGAGPRRLRTGRRVEMSKAMYPVLRLRAALHEVAFWR